MPQLHFQSNIASPYSTGKQKVGWQADYFWKLCSYVPSIQACNKCFCLKNGVDNSLNNKAKNTAYAA